MPDDIPLGNNDMIDGADAEQDTGKRIQHNEERAKGTAKAVHEKILNDPSYKKNSEKRKIRGLVFFEDVQVVKEPHKQTSLRQPVQIAVDDVLLPVRYQKITQHFVYPGNPDKVNKGIINIPYFTEPYQSDDTCQ
ncbi:MAG TPA: hypothetical protein VFR58_13980 [Flavisolibacter sp.]|nr:hypothetical protein [Flavisolibacter sp.]